MEMKEKLNHLLKVADACQDIAETSREHGHPQDALAMDRLGKNIRIFETVARKELESTEKAPWRMELIKQLNMMIDIDLLNYGIQVETLKFDFQSLLADVTQTRFAIDFAVKRLEEDREIYMKII